jgi:ABC-2 type transport system permease protein
VGNALVLTFFNAIFGVGSQLTRERETGTLIMLIASPSNRLGILLPRAILHIFDGLITVVFGFILAFVLFGLRIPFVVYPQLLLVLLAASFSAMSFGIIISCLGLLTRDLNLLLNIAAMALLGLTGANFPVESLPTWLSMLPWLLPLTRSIKLARLLIEGQAMMEHINLLVGEFLIGTVFIVIGFSVFTFIERSAIRKGTLDVL